MIFKSKVALNSVSVILLTLFFITPGLFKTALLNRLFGWGCFLLVFYYSFGGFWVGFGCVFWGVVVFVCLCFVVVLLLLFFCLFVLWGGGGCRFFSYGWRCCFFGLFLVFVGFFLQWLNEETPNVH